ncbi:platelet endothelial cell adhesion molecule isoform X3 [Heptranchias perlo]|uniref:platelet endothelial cell adhesion molecule isoform X3 n=1 Tax=Heptranchias perlo TaxID=212740 RepID=UPI00355A4379
MLKATFPLLTLLLCQAGKTESQQGVTINNVHIKSDPEYSENVEEGSTIILTCSADITIPPGLPSQISYLFYKGENEDILLENDTSHTRYTIESARASHSGYYHCVVAAGSKREKSQPTFVTIKGKLQSPVLTIHPMEVTIGNSTELRCETSGENSPFTFIFYKYKNEQQIRLGEIKDTKITIATYPLKVAENTEKVYSCKVQGTNMDSTSNSSKKVQITVQDPFSDPEFTIEPSNEIFEGDKLTMTCIVQLISSNPGVQPQLTIVKGVTPINTNAISDFAVEVSKTATANDTGEYKCNAKWNDALKSMKRQVIVTVPVSKPTLKSTPTDGNVVKYGNVSLTCAVSKGSCPITYKFYKEISGVPLHQRTLNSTEAVHYIISVNNEHSGMYSCEASNSANQRTQTKKSQNVTITVKVPVSNPTIKLNSLKVIYEPGERITLHCHSTNGTTPITYSLFLNKRFICSVTGFNTEPATFNVLINETKDGGEFKCKAENEIPNSYKYSEGISFTVKVKNQEDKSSKTHQRGPLQHSQGSLKENVEDIYSKVRKMTHPRLNRADSDTLIQEEEADSDRDHEGDYTNIMTSKGNGADSESDCEGDYTNVTSKGKAANADVNFSSDENNEVLYMQLDPSALQNDNVPQPQERTIYALITLNELRRGAPEKSES